MALNWKIIKLTLPDKLTSPKQKYAGNMFVLQYSIFEIRVIKMTIKKIKSMIAELYTKKCANANIDQIPVPRQQALISVEDSRFYDHFGIDMYGITRAFLLI